MRRAVAERAKDCCEYCSSQAQFATQSFSVEHIWPREKGGRTELGNLALACQGCNSHKHTKVEAVDPVTQEIAPLFHPRRQQWRDHFVWDQGYLQILGITPTGRATISVLRMNRAALVNLREVLYAMGKHPPASFH